MLESVGSAAVALSDGGADTAPQWPQRNTGREAAAHRSFEWWGAGARAWSPRWGTSPRS